MTASIRDLCAADHNDDAERIAGWTRNKTEAGVTRMLANPDTALYVAEIEGDVAAVGSVQADGSIGLNYVAPAFRFRGVSRALLAYMEDVLRDRGLTAATLVSTKTAHRFYRGAGWRDDGDEAERMGLNGIPMRKDLR